MGRSARLKRPAIWRLDAKDIDRSLSIEISDDIGAFLEANLAIDKYLPMPAFDRRQEGFVRGEAFWVRGLDAQGRLAHLQATFLVPEEPVEDLAAHLRARHARYKPGGVDGIAAVVPELCDEAQRISGRLCVQGEAWLRRDYRGIGLSRPLVRYCLAQAYRRWSPDWIFGFTFEHTSYERFTRAAGYYHLQAEAFRWIGPAGQTVRREGMVWSSRADLLDMIRETESEPPA